MNKTIREILAQLPNLTIDELETCFILLALERNKFNYTRTSREIGIKLRTLRNRLESIKALGHDIPMPQKGRPKLSE